MDRIMKTEDRPTPIAGAATDVVETGALLEVKALAKSFGPTRAVVDGTFSVRAGEVVALLGENGSGKSTLVKLLSGVYGPDHGEIRVKGERARLDSPRAALGAGIVTIFQEILAARDRSVLDNVWLGNGSARRSRELDRERRAKAAALWLTLTGETVDLDAEVGDLSLMQQQICVIVRALLRDPRVLILDESTSTLDVTLRDRLFDEIRKRCATGMAALFISHRMDEVLALADRFVALRSGAVVGTRDRGVSSNELLGLISGRDIATGVHRSAAEASRAHGALAVSARDVALRPGSRPFTTEVRHGEIIGLAGLEGHGQDEFLRCLAGLHQPHDGELLVDTGAPQLGAVSTYAQAVAGGVVYVPRDRKVEGMADVLPILDNYSLPTLADDSRLGWLRGASTRRRFRRDAAAVNFLAGRQDTIGRLSGGNQQKVIVARWLAARPRTILLNDPTRGVDLKTKHELYEVFRGLADAGVTVVMLSSEVDELVHLMDRVLVFHSGSLSAELTGEEISGDALVAAYFGQPGSSSFERTPS
jgi:ABC-type sugar transport system ATPase subunit